MRGRCDHAQQRLHCIPAGGPVAQVRAQRGCDRDGVAGGAQRLQLIYDELAHILGQQRTHVDGPAGELGQQQPLDNTQAAPPGSVGQAPSAAHVRVVAAQLVGDRTRWHRRAGDDALGPQDLQHRHQRGMQFHRCAQRTAQAIAARQVVAQELVDATVVEHVRGQVAHRHPVREVRHAVQATARGVGRIPASTQAFDVRRNLRRQRAFKQPDLKQGVDRRDLGHDGLRWWNRQCCPSSELMSSAASRRNADRQYLCGLPAYALPELLITGVFS